MRKRILCLSLGGMTKYIKITEFAEAGSRRKWSYGTVGVGVGKMKELDRILFCPFATFPLGYDTEYELEDLSTFFSDIFHLFLRF